MRSQEEKVVDTENEYQFYAHKGYIVELNDLKLTYFVHK